MWVILAVALISISRAQAICLSLKTVDNPLVSVCQQPFDPLYCGPTEFFSLPGSLNYYYSPKNKTVQSPGTTHKLYTCQGAIDEASGTCNSGPYQTTPDGGCLIRPNPTVFEGTTNPCCNCRFAGMEGQPINAHDCPLPRFGYIGDFWWNVADGYSSSSTVECGGDQGYYDQYNATFGSRSAWWGYTPIPDITEAFWGCYCRTTYYDEATHYQIGGSWFPDSGLTHTMGYGCIFPHDPPTPPYLSDAWGYVPESSFKRTAARSHAELLLQGAPPPISHRKTVGTPGMRVARAGVVTSTSLSKQELITMTTSPTNTSITIAKDGLTDHFTCSASPCINTVSDQFYINSGDLIVRVYVGSSQDDIEIFSLTAFVSCNIPKCVLCTEMFDGFNCFPWQTQMVIVLVMIAAVLAIILMIWAIATRTSKLSCCKGCCRKVSTGLTFLKNKVTRKKSVEEGEPEDLEMTEDESVAGTSSSSSEKSLSVRLAKLREKERKKASQASKGVSPKPTPTKYLGDFLIVAALAIFLFPLALAQPCVNGITIPSSATECSTSGTTQTCQLEFSVLLTIPSTNLAACLTFTDPSGNPIAVVKVGYTRALEVAPLQSIYYTSDWNPASFSNQRCSGSDMCGACDQYNPLTNPSACTVDHSYCALPQWMEAYNGDSYCSSQAGCINNGCGSCSPKCVYGRAIVIPVYPYCQVFDIISWYNRPQLTVNITTGGGSNVFPVDVISQVVGAGDNFTVTMAGTLQSNQFSTSEQVITCQTGFSGMGHAAQPNQMAAGGFGDIQANSPQQLNAGGAYNTASGLWAPQYSNTGITFLFVGSGYQTNIRSFDAFPTTRGSLRIDMSGYNLYAEDLSPPAVVLTVATNRPVTVSREVNVVCPDIQSANASGCYQCAQGFTVVLSAKSKCSAGQALVTTSDPAVLVGSASVVLDTVYSDLTIRLTSYRQSNDFVITLTSGEFTSSIRVTVDLVYQNQIGFANGTFLNNGTSSLDLANLSGWLLGLPNWLQGIIITLITLGSIAAAIVLLCLVSKGVKAAKAAKLESQYEQLSNQEKKQRILEAQKRLAMSTEPTPLIPK